MRHIERPPDSLPADLPEKQQTELAKAKEYFELSIEARKAETKVKFSTYKLASIKAGLEKLFSGKCAYCESVYSSTAPVDIEHYRPKGQVQEASDHDGYWWLAADWDNLLPSCIDCNRKRKQPIPKAGASLAELSADSKKSTLTNVGKKDSFPLADENGRGHSPADGILNERPLLLNPCKDDPSTFLDFTFDPAIGASIVFPRGTATATGLEPPDSTNPAANTQQVRSAMSIHVYGLNRLGLVQARTRVVRQLQFLADLIFELDELVADVNGSAASAVVKEKVESKAASMQDRIIREMKSMAEPSREYSATAQAWIEVFLRQI
tara:strand:+ start:24040 stop:25008 length:969 start_codon:yes stop_codon:yes gene_type:complete